MFHCFGGQSLENLSRSVDLMRWLAPLLVMVVCGGTGDRALGIDCLTRWCRDAYRRGLKWSCLPEGGCCDDYCPKPLPCVTLLCYCGCCDDYCRKPLPQLNCHFCCGYPDYYRCGPPDRPFCCLPRKQPCGHPVDYQRGPPDQPHCCLPAPRACDQRPADQCGPPEIVAPCRIT